MITIEETEALLTDMADELPEDFYKYLNGGIVLLPEEKRHSDQQTKDLYILGQYHRDKNLGRFITLYYGSFIRVFGYLPKEQFRQKLKETLLHEFTHHLESLAGERDLEIEDARQINDFIRSRKRQP